MAEMDRCSGIIFWLIKTLFKFIISGIKACSKIGHYFLNTLMVRILKICPFGVGGD